MRVRRLRLQIGLAACKTLASCQQLPVGTAEVEAEDCPASDNQTTRFCFCSGFYSRADWSQERRIRVARIHEAGSFGMPWGGGGNGLGMDYGAGETLQGRPTLTAAAYPSSGWIAEEACSGVCNPRVESRESGRGRGGPRRESKRDRATTARPRSEHKVICPKWESINKMNGNHRRQGHACFCTRVTASDASVTGSPYAGSIVLASVLLAASPLGIKTKITCKSEPGALQSTLCRLLQPPSYPKKQPCIAAPRETTCDDGCCSA